MKVKAFKILDTYLGAPICLVLGLIKRLRNTPEDTGEPRSILVVKLVAVGDVVATLPAVRLLRRRYPQARLAMLVTPRVSAIVEGDPDLDDIFYYDVLGEHGGVRGFLHLLDELRASGVWDWVVELDQRYRITSILGYLLKPARHVGFAISGQGRKGLFDVRVRYRTECHEVDTFVDVAAALGANREEVAVVPIAYGEAEKQAAERFLTEHDMAAGDLIVLVHPGTSGIATERQWPADRFADVCDWLVHRYGAKLIFTGAHENLQVIDEIRTKMATGSSVAAGRLSLKEFAALAEMASLMFSVDTGALHIAAAMGTPVIGLFGPSTPVKWGPYGSQHRVVYKQVECSPCVKPYLGQLPRCADPRCMEQIGVEEVKTVLREKLEELQPAGEGVEA